MDTVNEWFLIMLLAYVYNLVKIKIKFRDLTNGNAYNNIIINAISIYIIMSI